MIRYSNSVKQIVLVLDFNTFITIKIWLNEVNNMFCFLVWTKIAKSLTLIPFKTEVPKLFALQTPFL